MENVGMLHSMQDTFKWAKFTALDLFFLNSSGILENGDHLEMTDENFIG